MFALCTLLYLTSFAMKLRATKSHGKPHVSSGTGEWFTAKKAKLVQPNTRSRALSSILHPVFWHITRNAKKQEKKDWTIFTFWSSWFSATCKILIVRTKKSKVERQPRCVTLFHSITTDPGFAFTTLFGSCRFCLLVRSNIPWSNQLWP